MEKRRRRRFLLGTAAGCILAAAVLVLTGAVSINFLFAAWYEVRGVDISHYQGNVDWEELKSQEVDFAYIKATEGSGHVDEAFLSNRAGAEAAGVLYGAYHFFSFDSSPQTQAELFIRTAGGLSGKLPPAVDVEYYGDKEWNPPDKEQVLKSLSEFMLLLEEEYGTKPVIYTTYKVYSRYLKGEFSEYPLWIRNVYYPPIDLGREWTFWQYSDRGRLRGYEGEERHIDQNVFYGTKEELKKLLIPGKEEK